MIKITMAEAITLNREPDECFYCGTTAWASGGLEEHHLWRGKDRLLSPSIYLCNKCHRHATNSCYFAEKLKKIYLYQYATNRIKSDTIGSYGADQFNPKNYRSNERHAGGRSDSGPSKKLDESTEQLPGPPRSTGS